MTGKKKRVVLAVLLAVFLFSGGMEVRRQLLYREIEADRLEAAQVAGIAAPEAASPAPAQQQSAAPEREAALPGDAARLAAIDLEALRAVNEDVLGWIAIPGTELSYPLVQGRDNQYYLSRNWKREASGGGSVFLESTNDREMTDFHTIVYAHQMRDDSMFGVLKYYKNLDFWREHPSVYLAVGGRIYRYEIFAAQKTGVKSIVYRLDLEESCLEREFLQYCVDGSVIETGVVPEEGTPVLTLSTCVGNDRGNRWVVHAVLRAAWAAE